MENENTTAVAILEPVEMAAILDGPVGATGHPADRNPALVYLARLAAGSRPAMSGALDTAARILSSGAVSGVDFPWQQLRYQHTAALRAALLNKGAAPATVNKTLSAVRGVMKEAWRLGLMTAEDYARAADVKTVKQDRLPAGRALNPRELAALFQECAKDPLPTGRRDAALMAVLYGAGLRRAEAEALNLADFDTETGALTVHGGKGNKDRIAYAQEQIGLSYRSLFVNQSYRRGEWGEHMLLDQVVFLRPGLASQGGQRSFQQYIVQG